MVNSDEKLEVPDRLDLCQHFENIRLCRQSDLHITDSQGRKQNCESSEIVGHLKMISKNYLLFFS